MKYWRNYLGIILHRCCLHYEKEKGVAAKRLGREGRGEWPCCAMCRAFVVLDAFEARYVPGKRL